LNNEKQFVSGEDTIDINKYNLNIPIRIINLERRQDRKQKIIKEMTNAGFNHDAYEFVVATDGSKLEPTIELKYLFRGNDFGSRKGVIGCALTHYGLWKQLINSNDAYYFIMEDDFILCPNFKSRFENIIKSDVYLNTDTLFLGYHMFLNERNKNFMIYNNLSSNENKVEPLNNNLYIGGYFAYFINRNGARKMIEYIEKNGIKHGIDYLNKIIPNLNNYECQPQLVFSQWNENGKEIDSDIQNIYESLDFAHEKEKEKEKTIKIKMLCNWTTSENLCKEWSNMCETEFKWKNYELVWTDVKEQIDYYIIINYPPKGAYYDPKRTIVFQMEPWVYDNNKKWGVKTWGEWSEPDPSFFLAVRGCKTECHTNAYWQLELTLNDLQNSKLFEKTNNIKISSIMSSKYFDEGHIIRIDFLKFLETKGNIMIDIYGQDNIHNFQNYRGQLEMKNKSNGIKSYKYYFMMENNFERNYITEKLWEPILCETLVFYYGCPNITDYIDSRAFILLDINDFEASYQIIKKAIEEDWWSQRIDIIRKEKRKILDELAFFPVINKIIGSN
jgi:GR25 family glycosyltransferase involved in LPS biosynthesis